MTRTATALGATPMTSKIHSGAEVITGAPTYTSPELLTMSLIADPHRGPRDGPPQLPDPSMTVTPNIGIPMTRSAATVDTDKVPATGMVETVSNASTANVCTLKAKKKAQPMRPGMSKTAR